MSGNGSNSGLVRVDMINVSETSGADMPIVLRTIMPVSVAKILGEGLVKVSNEMAKAVN
jgi:hypothetical protein